MANIWNLAWKDLVLLSRDRMAMFFLLAFPILMGVLFGLMYQGIGTPQPGGVRVAVVDEDGSPMSQALIENLTEQAALSVLVTSLEEALQQLRTGKAVGIVIVPEGFGRTAGIFWADNPVPLRVGRDPSRSAEAAMLEGYLMEAAGRLMAERFQDTQFMRGLIDEQRTALAADPSTNPLTKLLVGQLFSSLDQLVDNLDQVTQLPLAEGEAVENRGGRDFQFVRLEPFDAFSRPQATGPRARSGWDLSFPQSILWGVMASAAGFAMSLVREQTRGTLLRLCTSPLQPREIILGKGLACFLATTLVVVMMLALGWSLGMRAESPGLLAVSVAAVAFCFVGIMMAMSAMGSTEEGVGGAGWAINMVMAMFGGAMMPLAFMPSFMKGLSDFSPVKWSIVALEGAIWRQYTIVEMAVPWAVLLLIGGLGWGIGLTLFRRRLARNS